MHTRASLRNPKQQDKLKHQTIKRDNPLPRSLQSNMPLGLERRFGNQAIQKFMGAYMIQAKLNIGAANDVYEQEADRVAAQVMRMPDRQIVEGDARTSDQKPDIHRSCTDCESALQRQAEEEGEEALVQPKSRGRSGTPSSTFEGGVPAIQGHGAPLSKSVRNFFEPRFGSNFSDVRIHADEKAGQLAGQVNAKAFTLGKDLVFASGQYSPETREGKQLLAHELTHVVQQGGGQVRRMIQMKRKFTPGRPAHDHKSGKWAAVQAAAKKNCSVTDERGRIECVCATLSPENVMKTVLFVEMDGKPLATEHLNHYISGGGKKFDEDSNLRDLIDQDDQVRGKFSKAIAVSKTNNIPIWQGDYKVQDFRYAFGGIDRVDYDADVKKGTVDIWFKDRYDFHPAGFGYKNKGVGDDSPPGRITNCVHAAAVELKSTGSAADYWMQGEATFPLSLFTASPSTGSPDDDL